MFVILHRQVTARTPALPNLIRQKDEDDHNKKANHSVSDGGCNVSWLERSSYK